VLGVPHWSLVDNDSQTHHHHAVILPLPTRAPTHTPHTHRTQVWREVYGLPIGPELPPPEVQPAESAEPAAEQ
jgi:hypothetical protein